MSPRPDWQRLQKALSVEANSGFQNLQGRQYRFGEFLCLSLGNPPPPGASADDRRRWQHLAEQFSHYHTLDLPQRQTLVASARRFLHQLRRTLEAPANPLTPSPAPTTIAPGRQTKVAAATLSPQSSATSPRSIQLTTLLGNVARLSKRQEQLLSHLGLHTVRDLLFYFPRDYLDYARQVTIDQLEAGETVTLVGQVVSCNCFTSPKNQNLTIFQMQLRDQTGAY